MKDAEKAKIRKENALVTSERYKTEKTIPLLFHFEPHPYQSANERLKGCAIQHEEIEGKDVYIVDSFFLPEEAQELRDYTQQAEFRTAIFAEHSSKERGEEPARAMDNKEKWQFFSKPPKSIDALFKLLGFLADKLDADITTLPWEMHDEHICAPTFATNLIGKLSPESEDLGKHSDYDTEKEGVSFAIPVLYEEGKNHPHKFVNGAVGNPWLVTLMLYAASKDFDPAFGLGSVYCTSDGEVVLRQQCKHMRFVLFEGDIVHGIEKSEIPEGKKPWRCSYVFKLIFNPKKREDSMKEKFHNTISKGFGK